MRGDGDELAERVLKLLTAVCAVCEIHCAMYAAGMTDEDILEGRALLVAAIAVPVEFAAPTGDDVAAKQRAAEAELDNWDEPNFERYCSMLVRRFPAAAEFVFHDLSPSTGLDAARGVGVFLDRVEQLDDKKAVALLAKRDLPRAERKRLRKLVELALAKRRAPPSVKRAGVDERRERLVALQGWYDEWATTAIAVVRKRGYLIRMGLAGRGRND